MKTIEADEQRYYFSLPKKPASGITIKDHGTYSPKLRLPESIP